MLARRASLFVALALTLAALGATSAHAVPASGLRGLVTRSPIMPVCMEGVPCSAPAENTPLVFSRGGKFVRTRTDSAGRYRVVLTPGWWKVTTAGGPRIGSGITPRAVPGLGARLSVFTF